MDKFTVPKGRVKKYIDEVFILIFNGSGGGAGVGVECLPTDAEVLGLIPGVKL